MRTYTINYRDNEHDSGVQIEIEAQDDQAAIAACNKKVESGYRNQSFANVEIEGGTYSCANQHGNAVGQTTYH